jgi:hypothetical protein
MRMWMQMQLWVCAQARVQTQGQAQAQAEVQAQGQMRTQVPCYTSNEPPPAATPSATPSTASPFRYYGYSGISPEKISAMNGATRSYYEKNCRDPEWLR